MAASSERLPFPIYDVARLTVEVKEKRYRPSRSSVFPYFSEEERKER